MTKTVEQTATHVELILQEIGSLPTLSPIAVRVMHAANAGDADLREISSLIESDPALSAKVLALCRRADWALTKRVMTVNRAVVMLGLEAVRAAVLSVEIHEAFGPAIEKSAPQSGRRAGDPPPPARVFDRREMWRHSIAVAAASELIAELQPGIMGGYTAQEAFLAGLLHDLGKVALDALLPRSFERVAIIARDRRLNIADVERKVLGLDHHAAGKRLGEHWGLPHALQDVMWLHNQPAKLLPDVPHRVLIAVVSIAHAQVRRLHIGWSGNGAPPDDPSGWCAEFGIDPRLIGNADSELIERVSRRCAHLGLDDTAPTTLLLESIARANGQLGQVSASLDARARDAGRAETILGHVTSFLAGDAVGGKRSLGAALAGVCRHAQSVIGGESICVVTQSREGALWMLHRANNAGDGVSHVELNPPKELASLRAICESGAQRAIAASTFSWLVENARKSVQGSGGAGGLHALPLAGAGGGFCAVVLHSRANVEAALGEKGLSALASVWGSVLSSASRHDGARRLSEQLAEANRSLAEMQTRLVDQRSMQKLAQVAAGAAHEMNNPLTVISGMAQVLADGAREPSKQSAATKIVQATEKLSELITSLHLFAAPPKPTKSKGDVAELLNKAARLGRDRALAGGAGGTARAKAPPNVNVSCEPGIGTAMIDQNQIALAIAELIVNGVQANPKRGVDVRAGVDGFDGRLVITVTDDGAGMSPTALEHAFDPFFSELAAGRRPGLGLTRARRYVDLHGGEVTLESTPGKGTTARIILPEWRDSQSRRPIPIANQAA